MPEKDKGWANLLSIYANDGMRFWNSSKENAGKKMAANKYTGTQTEKNLQEAFTGESQARNKYTYFASVAKKEGY